MGIEAENPERTTEWSCAKIQYYIFLFLAFLKRNYSNIICVDWAKLSGPNIDSMPSNSLLGLAFFPTVTFKSTSIVARRIADFLIFLKHQKVVKNYKHVHLIGASLGAQISGAVGFYINEQKNGRIGWITGLDPVGNSAN